MYSLGVIYMADEKACGAIIFTMENNVRKYVILCGHGIYQGYYGFPKGHVEEGETEQETVIREVKEETGLDVVLYDGFRTVDTHALARDGRPNDKKTNVYSPWLRREGTTKSRAPSGVELTSMGVSISTKPMLFI